MKPFFLVFTQLNRSWYAHIMKIGSGSALHLKPVLDQGWDTITIHPTSFDSFDSAAIFLTARGWVREKNVSNNRTYSLKHSPFRANSKISGDEKWGA